jgi:hypothetical protein
MSVTEIPFTQMTEAEWQTRLNLAACYRHYPMLQRNLVYTGVTRDKRVQWRHSSHSPR